MEIGDVNILVHALPMSGRKYVMGAGKGRITLEKQWHGISQPYALQAIVKDILVEDPGLKTYCTVQELFPTGTSAFMLGQPHYGAQGEVIKIDPEHKGRIQLKFQVRKPTCEKDFCQNFFKYFCQNFLKYFVNIFSKYFS